MKSIFKRFTALMLVLALALSTGVLASAATTTAKSYGLTIKSNELQFTVDGKAATTMPSKNSIVTIKTDSNKNMLVSYTDKSGKSKSASLGKQKTLTISGSAASIKLDKSLGKDSIITLASGASATKLAVAAPCTVKINGKVGTLSVTAAAKVTIASTASVTKKSISSASAKVTTAKKSTSAVDDEDDYEDEDEVLPKGKTLKMKVGVIKLDDEEYLEDIESELSDAVEVTIPKDDETMYGTFKWNSSGSVRVVDGKSYAFTFFPDDENYETKKGSIKVYVGGSGSELTLEYKDDVLEFKEGARVSNLNSEMRKNVTAYDDDDKKITGSLDFDESSGNTLEDGRNYNFTFVPGNKRYDSVSGSITVTVIPK